MKFRLSVLSLNRSHGNGELNSSSNGPWDVVYLVPSDGPSLTNDSLDDMIKKLVKHNQNKM